MKQKAADDELRCSFCHKSQDVVGKLVASPDDDSPRAHICDECVAVCNSILGDAADPDPSAGWTFAEPIQVLLDPDIALVFRDAESVNSALRQLLTIAARTPKSGM